MKTFINVAQMKLASLKEGQFVETGGYYTKGDAGQAKYLIVAAQAADGYGDHTLANGTVAVLQVVSDVNINQFGGLSGADSTDAIYAAINYGSNVVTCNSSQAFIINRKIVPLENQTLDLNNSKLVMAAGVAFSSGDSMIELLNANSHVVNFELDGNKSAVTHPIITGTDLAGAIVRANNSSLSNGYIHHCMTNGAFSYGSNISNIQFQDLRIEYNNWVAMGNEVPTFGDANAEDITYKNIETLGNGLGGIYLAGGKNIIIDNVNTNDANRNYFYVGDAGTIAGGLINCKVSNSKLGCTNGSVNAVEIQGEIQTGADTGNRLECDVSFSNVECAGNNSINALVVEGGAKLRYSNLTTTDGTFTITDGEVEGARLKSSGAKGMGVSTKQRAILKDTEVVNYGTLAGSQAGVFLDTGSDGTVLDGLKVGADAGETGEHGVWGVGGLEGIEIKRFKDFTGSGSKFNNSTADLIKWDLDNNDFNRDLLQQGTWTGKAVFLGGGYLWIDATGDVRIQIGATPPASDLSGVIVGTQH